MDPAATFRVNAPAVLSEIIDDEVVMINLDSGVYYSAEGVGAHIWRLLQDGLSLRRIFETVRRSYRGDEGCMQDTVLQFIAKLQAEMLIVEDPEQKPAAEGIAASEPVHAPLPFEPPLLGRYDDMKDMLLLDPIHEVGESGWPSPKES